MYKPLTYGSIRVIKLEGTCLAGKEGDKFRDLAIRCTFHTISLTSSGPNAPKFAALSYVWGSSPSRRPLICNGQEVPVTQNLHDAPWKFASYDARPEYLWVDAVCINQQDEEEKAIQVALMGDLYKAATVVLVWLGTGAAVSGQAFERYWTYMQRKDRVALLGDTEAWKKGREFMNGSDWLRRVWTLQEIVLAERAELHCGPFVADWSAFTHGDFDGMWDIAQMRERTGEGGMDKLSDIVQRSASRQATQLQDRIFGLRGLYFWDWPIKATYGDSAIRVLAEATEIIAHEQGDLRFLRQLRLRQADILPLELPDVPGDSNDESGDLAAERKNDWQSISSSFRKLRLRLSRSESEAKGQETKEAGKRPRGLVFNTFRPRMNAVSWVPTWMATSTKESRQIVTTLDYGRTETHSRHLTKLYSKSRMHIKLNNDTAVLSVRGIVLGRVQPIEATSIGEHFWQGRGQFVGFPQCVRNRYAKMAEKPKVNLQCDVNELYKLTVAHDNKRCACKSRWEAAINSMTGKYTTGMAWVCYFFGATDFTVIEPLTSENRVTFAVLLSTARSNTDQTARVLSNSRTPGTEDGNDCGWRLGSEFTSIPTTFGLVGELPEKYKSPFWSGCPNKLPNANQITEIQRSEAFRDQYPGATDWQVKPEHWPAGWADGHHKSDALYKR